MKMLAHTLIGLFVCTLSLTNVYSAAALPSAGGYGYGGGSVAPRMKNTVRTRNIYGVNVGPDLTANSRIFGDYDGLGNNYFGSPSANTGKTTWSYPDNEKYFAETCTVSTDSPGLRYGGGMGYEKGFSACEAAEYKEYLKRR